MHMLNKQKQQSNRASITRVTFTGAMVLAAFAILMASGTAQAQMNSDSSRWNDALSRIFDGRVAVVDGEVQIRPDRNRERTLNPADFRELVRRSLPPRVNIDRIRPIRPTNAIPEPHSALLFAAGIGVVAAVRRRH